mgnify:CR=1 FL=1
MSEYRTLVAYVEDKPGVLNRFVSLFRRRNFNIASLTVGRTHEAGVSRMTVVVKASADVAKRIEANLYKLVNVLRVDDITDTDNISRDLVLIKVNRQPAKQAELDAVISKAEARVVDESAESLVVELAASREDINALIDTLRPFGIIEMAQSGIIAMLKGQESVAKRALATALAGEQSAEE